MTDRPPGRDGDGIQAVSLIPGCRRRQTTSTPPSAEVTSTVAHGGRTLPYDQIDPARLVIGDATGRIDGHLGVLGVALAQWMARDDTRPQPEVRRAANTAMDAIDAMLAELHQLRSQLLGQIKVSDKLAADRADALLARLREATP